MQPDQQDNYRQNDSYKKPLDEIPEMYTPESNNELEPENEPISSPEKPVIENAPVHWSATEYIYREKNGLWFVIFTVVVLALIAVDMFFIKSYTFSALVIVMAVAVVVYSRRPPRNIEYTLSGDQGLYIGERLYHFSEFKSFGLIQDSEHNSIMLIPVKRFSLGVSVYFPQDVGEQIVDIFGARLPMESVKIDLLDKIVRKLRL